MGTELSQIARPEQNTPHMCLLLVLVEGALSASGRTGWRLLRAESGSAPPQQLGGLLDVEAALTRESEQLDQRLRLAQPPGIVGDDAVAGADGEHPEETDAQHPIAHRCVFRAGARHRISKPLRSNRPPTPGVGAGVRATDGGADQQVREVPAIETGVCSGRRCGAAPGKIATWNVCLESVDTSCGPPTRWPWARGIAIA